MFGALNRFISRLDSDSPSRDVDGHGAFGFQVLRNKNNEIPIEPWFDFVVGINGRQIVHPTPTYTPNPPRSNPPSTRMTPTPLSSQPKSATAPVQP